MLSSLIDFSDIRVWIFIAYVIVVVIGLLLMARGSMDGQSKCKDVGLSTLLVAIIAGVGSLGMSLL